MTDLRDILLKVKSGELDPDEAAAMLTPGERDLGFARIDTDRRARRGLPEVIYAPGKTAPQIIAIMATLKDAGQNIFVTRVSPEQAGAISAAVPDAVHHRTARAVTVDVEPALPAVGRVSVVCAGTSDLPVAEEAALTAERMGAAVELICDVGVAGLHRLMGHIDTLRASRAVVVVAGMEGALPSVVGGLIDKPVIAVPTSVGYGTGLSGIAALLAMLNSCVPGVAVVNIDNGFGAGVAAAMINRVAEERS